MSWPLVLLTETGRKVTVNGVREPVYLMPDEGRELRMEDAPFGAVFYTSNPQFSRHKGPDGLAVVIKIPANADPQPGDEKTAYTLWQVDGPSYRKGKQGAGWTRAGAVPGDLTVNPSIFHNPPDGFHGWVRKGRLYSVSEKLPQEAPGA
jgi:hypothetical protein